MSQNPQNKAKPKNAKSGYATASPLGSSRLACFPQANKRS